MSLEETINKLIKAVETGMNHSSRASTPNIPWDGNIPTDCKCVLWADVDHGIDDTDNPAIEDRPVHCVKLMCGKKYYKRVFDSNAPNGVGYWQPISRN